MDQHTDSPMTYRSDPRGHRPGNPPQNPWPSSVYRFSVAVLLCITTAVCVATPEADATVLANGLRLIDRNYLFPEELDAPRLLGESLERVERLIPAFRARDLGDGAYLASVGPCQLRLEAPPQARLPDLAPILARLATFIDRCAGELPESLASVESLLLGGVLAGLDPYSTVFDAQRKTEHSIQFRGKLAGIGARIGIRDGALTLITVYTDSPAHRAGLRDSDIVRRIDGVSTTNMAVSDAVARIRGKVGTPVRLTVERDGDAKHELFSVTRGLVTIPSVKAHTIESGVVYAAISHFSQTTPADFRKRVGDLVVAGTTSGVIIDLRRNSGGSMLGSSAIGDLFLDHGLLITTAGRHGSPVSGLTSEIRATLPTPFADLPVVILTSPRTASGSELLAASLRNNDRAILIGERTFGKGTVQKTYSLGADSSIKLTVGRFLPNGLAIPGGGMVPDVEVRRLIVRDAEVHFAALRDNTEELPFWLRAPTWLDTEANHTPIVINLVEEIDDEEQQADDDPGNDPVVRLAAEILSRHGSVSAAAMNEDARVLMTVRAKQADERIEDYLAGLDIDWRAAPADLAGTEIDDNALTISATFADGPLRAGHRGNIAVTVTNTSTRPLYRIHGILRAKVGFLDGHGMLFGYLEPGASRTWSIEAEPPVNLYTARIEAKVELHAGTDTTISVKPLYLAIDESPRPRLAHRLAVNAGAESGDLTVVIEFENRGDADIDDLRAYIKHPDSDDVELVTGNATVEKLAPGDKAQVELSLRVLASRQQPQDVELLISVSSYRMLLESDLTLVAGSEFGPWHEAPRIHLEGLQTGGTGGAYRLVAVVDDDTGIASLYSRIEGNQVDYVDGSDKPRRTIPVKLPWRPDAEVQRIEIVAVDTDGLTTRFVTDL